MTYADAMLVTLAATVVAVALHFVATRRTVGTRSHRSRLVGLATIVMFTCVAVLVGSAWWGSVTGSFRGWPLFVHLAAAGPFVGLVTLYAFVAAVRQWRGVNDTQTRWALFAFLVAALGTIGTILASMVPIFGTDDLHRLLEVHRWFGLSLAVSATVLAYLSSAGSSSDGS
ncbi:MAG: hypothetical protein AAF488_11470 [Planctomycetota bacterium]